MKTRSGRLIIKGLNKSSTLIELQERIQEEANVAISSQKSKTIFILNVTMAIPGDSDSITLLLIGECNRVQLALLYKRIDLIGIPLGLSLLHNNVCGAQTSNTL